MKENSENKDDAATQLANRLLERIDKKGEGKSGGPRLGDRLSKEAREERRKNRETLSTSIDESKEKVIDFFEEFKELSEQHPELKNVTVNELKQMISRVGMEHSDEVIEMLRNKKTKSEVRNMKSKWITH